jgi:tyrosyl-tRNA synthetase
MTFLGEKPNIGVIMGILPGTDGEIKMSKSLGNHIPLLASPQDMYGKVMSIPDEAMGDYFRLVSRWTPPEIAELEDGLSSGKLHPRDIKMKLAYEIVSIYHSEASAKEAESAFVNIFQRGEIPEEMDTFTLQPNQTVLEVLVEGKLVSSKSEGRRMLAQNAVKLDGEILTDANQSFPHPGVLKVGKRRFLHVT